YFFSRRSQHTRFSRDWSSDVCSSDLEWRSSFGEQHKQLLQLAALQSGYPEDAYDETGRVHWQDMEVRSLSQAVDALGKAAEMLGVPQEALWLRIPDVDQDDVAEWIELNKQRQADALAADPLAQLAGQLDRQAKPAGDEE